MPKYVILSKDQEDDFSMFLTVKQFLNSIMESVSEVLPFLDAYNKFSGFVDEISTNSRTRDSLRSGAAKTKADVKALLTAEIGRIAGLLFNYGFSTGNVILKEAANEATEYRLMHLRDTLVSERALEILDLAASQGDKLLPYKVTAQRISKARQQAEEYQKTVGETGSTLERCVATTKIIRIHFTEAKAMLKLIDNFMNDFGQDDSEALAGYKAARKVHRTGSKREKKNKKSPVLKKIVDFSI